MTDDVLLRLFEDSRQPARCRGCESDIDWFETLASKRMPMNRGAVPRKSENHAETRRVVAFYAASDSHWATCAARSQFAKGR